MFCSVLLVWPLFHVASLSYSLSLMSTWRVHMAPDQSLSISSSQLIHTIFCWNKIAVLNAWYKVIVLHFYLNFAVLLITGCCLFFPTMAEAPADTIVTTSPSQKTPTRDIIKRIRKCPSWRIPHDDHAFGLPGPQCTGPNKTPENSNLRDASAILNKSAHSSTDDVSQIDFYKQQLEILNQEEQRLIADINGEEGRLLREIEEKKQEIARLKASRVPGRHAAAPISGNPQSASSSNSILPSIFDKDGSHRIPPPALQKSTVAQGHVSNERINVNNLNMVENSGLALNQRKRICGTNVPFSQSEEILT